MDSDSSSVDGEDFLSTLGSIRSDIKTEADEIRKDFESIKCEQKAFEEKRVADLEEETREEKKAAAERKARRKEKKARRRRIESARERGKNQRRR